MTTDSEQLDEFAKFILATLQESKDFVMEQAPLVIQELLTWKAWEHGMTAVVLFAMIIVPVLLCKALWRVTAEEFDKEMPRAGGGIILGLMASTLFGFGVANLFWLVQVLVAPRVYLIEWAMQQLGK
jgi:hypothetical protein